MKRLVIVHLCAAAILLLAAAAPAYAAEPLEKVVILQRVYLDGEISEETTVETIWSMEDFWDGYADWQLIDQSEEWIVFQKQENDISPLLNANGFFGMSRNGILSIYKGRPEQEQIIQTFFRLDVEKMGGQQQEQLMKGIPVNTKEHFEEVLETYKSYSLPAKGR